MLDELNHLFESSTIKPSFDYVHIILALFIFEENQGGIGRYRLKEDLNIGSGTARSLITKLNEKSNFIRTVNKDNKRKGHVLTEKGLYFLNKIKKKIPFIEVGDLSILEDLIIESHRMIPFYCLIKNVAYKLSNGIEQRDAAIKMGGIGATCLIFDGNDLTFPDQSSSDNGIQITKADEKILNYFKSQLNTNNLNLEKNDVIIIGLGDSLPKARLAALNAAVTFIKKK